MTIIRTILALVLLASCGGSDKPKKNEDWKKPWFQYQSNGTVRLPVYPAARTTRKKAPAPTRIRPMAFEILEDTALALMQFYQRTGRRCPTGAEARQLLVGKRSLSALMHQHPMFFRCEETSGFSLSSFSNDGPHDMVFLNNGCRVITVRTRIGPLLPAKPDPTVWERDPAMDRELHKCYFAPLNILTVCHGEVCTQSDVEEWLARHSVPAN